MSKPRDAMNPASLRGLAVLAVAVALGFLLLSRSEELTPTVEARSDRTTPTTVDRPPATELAPTTGSTTPIGSAQPRPPAEVNVIVLNGSGGVAKGVAGDTTTKLADLGYKTVEPGNAPAREASVIYYAEGYQPEAAAVQQALGLPGTVEPLQDLPTAEAQGANLVIVLGGDAAALVVEGPSDSTTTTSGVDTTTTSTTVVSTPSTDTAPPVTDAAPPVTDTSAPPTSGG